MVFSATNIMWAIIMFSAFSLILGFLLGLLISSRFDIALKVGARNQMEFYAKEMNKKLAEEVEKPTIRPTDLFPEDLNKDYGLPRELR